MSMYQPTGEAGRAASRGLGALLVVTLAVLALLFTRSPVSGDAFVASAPGLRAAAAPQASLRLQPLRAAAEQAEEAAAEDEDEDEEEEEEVAMASSSSEDGLGKETPSKEWFENRLIDKHKVNSVLFDMFKKEKNFFPHKLQPGDTVRVYYLQPVPTGDKEARDYKSYDPKAMREVFFDGIIMNFKGASHARTMTMRAMVGKGEMAMGVELNFPMHSKLVTKIEVLRRGYIGTNKNAYFMRMMVGKRNMIPLDKERTEMDNAYQSLREEFRADEIPESEYPTSESDRYPLPVWKQDQDEWDEEKYKPEDVDQRSEFEQRVLGRFRMRRTRTGRYGGKH